MTDWTEGWPTEPGDYWCWDPFNDYEQVRVAKVMRTAKKTHLYVIANSFVEPAHHKTPLWWCPRTHPAPPMTRSVAILRHVLQQGMQLVGGQLEQILRDVSKLRGLYFTSRSYEKPYYYKKSVRLEDVQVDAAHGQSKTVVAVFDTETGEKLTELSGHDVADCLDYVEENENE